MAPRPATLGPPHLTVGAVNDHIHGCCRAIDYRTTDRSR
jgi:hypothetical protein